MEENTNKDMQEEEHGVTFGAICRVVFQWKRFLCLIAITLVAAIAAFLCVKYVVNSGKVEYTAQFDFHLERVAVSSNLYDSGQFFAEESTLNAVKASDQSFEDVDIENLLPGGKYPIRVTKTVETSENSPTRTYYTVTVNVSPFGDKDIADRFVKTLIGYIKQDAVDGALALAQKDGTGFNGYQAQLKYYNDAQTYEEKLTILSAQRDYLIGLYDGWIQNYDELYFVEGKSMPLADLREAVRSAFSETMYTDFLDELNANAYVPNGEDATTLQTRLNTYNEQKDLNEKKLAALETELSELLEQYKNVDGTASSLMPQFGEFHARIAALLEENVELQKKIDTLSKLRGDDAAKQEYMAREKEFSDSLQTVYNALARQSEQIADVAMEIAGRETYTTLLSYGASGGMNAVLVGVAVAILVFLLGSAVCCAVVFSRGKNVKKEGQARQPEETQEE